MNSISIATTDHSLSLPGYFNINMTRSGALQTDIVSLSWRYLPTVLA